MSGHLLRAVLQEVEAGLRQLPPATEYYDGDWIRAHDARRADLARLLVDPLTRDRQLKLEENWTGARVTMLGISVHSTSGASDALRNWCEAARRQLSGSRPR